MDPHADTGSLDMSEQKTWRGKLPSDTNSICARLAVVYFSPIDLAAKRKTDQRAHSDCWSANRRKPTFQEHINYCKYLLSTW